MTRVALMSPCIMDGDAVCNDVLGMYRALLERGHEACVFADWVISDPEYKHVNDLKQFLKDDTDVVIYHHAVGWDNGMEILTNLKCKRVIKYHNVTPPEFFEGISELYMSTCKAGKDQLKVIARLRCDLYLSDSEFNMQELILEGASCSISSVVPPFHHIDRLDTLQADPAVFDSYHDGKTNILMVGRMVPNKGHALLIDAFAAYHRRCNANSRLLIVGKQDERMGPYIRMLAEKVAGLGLQDAIAFCGEVSDRALRAYYMVANVFIITSEHEGFCVPLVEAMAMRVPIVAYGSTAVPGTVGDVGVVWRERDPELIAESIDHIVRDQSISSGLGLKGWRRYMQFFTNDRIEARFLSAVHGVI